MRWPDESTRCPTCDGTGDCRNVTDCPDCYGTGCVTTGRREALLQATRGREPNEARE